MNRKQRNNQRKTRNQEARENYKRNKRHWLYQGGPAAVMDDPTEEHVNALLTQWLAPRRLFYSKKPLTSWSSSERIFFDYDMRVEEVLAEIVRRNRCL